MIEEIEDESRTKQISRSNRPMIMLIVGITTISVISIGFIVQAVFPTQLAQGDIDVRSTVHNLKGTSPSSIQEASIDAMKEASIEAAKEAGIAMKEASIEAAKEAGIAMKEASIEAAKESSTAMKEASIEAAKEASIAAIKETNIALTKTSDTPDISLTHPKCLSSDEDFDAIVSSSNQVFIVMPPKASGSSINQFVKRCTTIVKEFNGDNKKDNEKFLTHRLDLPQIVSSHIREDVQEEMVHDLIQQTTKDSLVVYIYREETDRLVSAIKHFVENRLCTPPNGRWGTPPAYRDAATISKDGKKCVVDESRLVQAIKDGSNEIGKSVYKSLTCNNYDALEENSPNFIFLDFRKVDELQAILAKHKCPNLASEVPYHANDSGDRELTAYIRMDMGDEPNEVSVKEWAEAKRSLLEWTLKLKKNVSCQGKTRRVENSILACDDGALQVSSANQTFTLQ